MNGGRLTNAPPQADWQLMQLLEEVAAFSRHMAPPTLPILRWTAPTPMSIEAALIGFCGL